MISQLANSWMKEKGRAREKREETTKGESQLLGFSGFPFLKRACESCKKNHKFFFSVRLLHPPVWEWLTAWKEAACMHACMHARWIDCRLHNNSGLIFRSSQWAVGPGKEPAICCVLVANLNGRLMNLNGSIELLAAKAVLIYIRTSTYRPCEC